MAAFTDTLPGGYWDPAGMLHREFELADLTGREEELLAQNSLAETASVVSAVLSRCVRRLGGISPVTEEIARGLLIADRQYLLLKLRQRTFGDLVHADLFCPWAECGRRLSLQFSLAGLPVEEAAERAPVYTFTLSELALGEADPARRVIRFRLPNGGDQEAVSGLVAINEAEALSQLLCRTVVSIGPRSPVSDDEIVDLPSLARAEIEAEMFRVAPKIELNMETTCSECGRSFVAPFDLQRLFFGELRTDSDWLFRQVHYLAYNYHWAEPEIMAMPRTKRQKYIDLLAEEIERLNDGA